MKNPGIIFLAGVIFLFQPAAAQQKPTVKAGVDKHRVLLGEAFHLTIDVESSAAGMKGLSWPDSIAHFEFMEDPVPDSSRGEGPWRYKMIYTLRSFDSGHWVIPSFSLSKGIKTDTIPMDIVFTDFDPDQDYHDIKDIIEIGKENRKHPWWYAVGAGVIILLVILYLLRKKRTVPGEIPKPVADPYDEAMEQLNRLQQSKKTAKEFHSGLAAIFRLYILRRKGILSLQKTTNDLVLQLGTLELEKERYDRLAQTLRLGDFVKFAKYVPAEEDNRHSLETIKESIMIIEKTETGPRSAGG